MKTALALAFTVLAGALIAVVCWRNREPLPVQVDDHVRPETGATASVPLSAEVPRAPEAPAHGKAAGGTADPADAYVARRAAAGRARAATPSWPVLQVGASTSASTAPGAEPAVPVKVAFRALWYLGTDPGAERTWSRAINDPNMPAEVRSDLIVDMVDEGYTNNDKPTKADLPVILARLAILERHAPNAMDQVNATAFQQAYHNLLDLYVKLGGDPARR